MSRTLRRTLLTGAVAATLVAAATVAVNAQAATAPAPAPLAAATPTVPPAAYPGPGVVTGDIGVHDPTMVKTPSGSYIVAHTGDNIPLKTSTDRTAFRNAGAVFPGGAPWTTTYTGGSRNLWAP